jgi:hypothetical protein
LNAIPAQKTAQKFRIQSLKRDFRRLFETKCFLPSLRERSDEAIQFAFQALDCFASLAMTIRSFVHAGSSYPIAVSISMVRYTAGRAIIRA